jgi:hypothetical protein
MMAIGESGDAKPTSMPVGSTFYEHDTGKLYVSADGSTWTQYANNIYTANVYPITDNTYDLGSAALSFNDLHVQNLIYATSVAGNWNPSADNTYDLGENSTPLEWKDLYIDGIAYLDTVYVEVAGRVNDDIILAFGTGDDIAMLNRSTSLTANTTLANVFLGTPVVPALAANSLIISNVTAAGDILLATNNGGNSQANIFVDASAGSTHILAAGVSQFNVALGRVNIYDDIILQLGTNGDQAFVSRSTILAADTVLGNVLIGTPESQAIAANSLMISNITASGDLAMYVNKGGNSQMVFWADGSSGDTALLAASGQSIDGYIAGTQIFDLSGAGLLTIGASFSVAATAWGTQAYGIQIDQATDDAPLLQFLSVGDVAHGMTSLCDTALYGLIRKNSGTSGGLNIHGLGELGYQALIFLGSAGAAPDNTKSTAARGVVEIQTFKKSGTTHAATSSTDNIVVFAAGSTAQHVFGANGNLWMNGILTCAGFDTTDRLRVQGTYLEYSEMAAPGAGGANTARVYAFEGAGDALTDLCAVFQDGSIDVFAQEVTEPDSPIFQFPDNTKVSLVMKKPDRKTIQFVAGFPDGRAFVMREIRYPTERWN